MCVPAFVFFRVRAIMQARLDTAVHYHCDGVEPDNVDGYSNHNGLGLTARDQLDYNRWLARGRHDTVTIMVWD